MADVVFVLSQRLLHVLRRHQLYKCFPSFPPVWPHHNVHALFAADHHATCTHNKHSVAQAMFDDKFNSGRILWMSREQQDMQLFADSNLQLGMLNEVRIFELRIISWNSNSDLLNSEFKCTKTGVGIEAWLSHNRLRTRRDLFVLCRRLLPAVSPINWRGRCRRCWCLITPPRPHTSLPLRSRRAVCLLSCCCSQCLPWLTNITRCVRKGILADTRSDWRNKHLCCDTKCEGLVFATPECGTQTKFEFNSNLIQILANEFRI